MWHHGGHVHHETETWPSKAEKPISSCHPPSWHLFFMPPRGHHIVKASAVVISTLYAISVPSLFSPALESGRTRLPHYHQGLNPVIPSFLRSKSSGDNRSCPISEHLFLSPRSTACIMTCTMLIQSPIEQLYKRNPILDEFSSQRQLLAKDSFPWFAPRTFL